MSIQVGCMICGEQSPESIETGPAIEWSNAHRCATAKLIALAEDRRTATRLGRMVMRETDRDLVIMGELAKRLAEVDPEGGWDYAVRDAQGKIWPVGARTGDTLVRAQPSWSAGVWEDVPLAKEEGES